MSRVSVIIPTYNRRDYVQEAIDSVLAQTYTDYEIIVIDDGSTDGTGEALQARYGDRIHYEWQENQGESVARNRGIELAQGEYIAFLDSDDLWLPEKLARQLEPFQESPDIGMICSTVCLIDETGRQFQTHAACSPAGVNNISLEALLHDNQVPGPSTVLLRREMLYRLGGFDPQIRFGEDWDLWIRVAGVSRIVLLSEPVAFIRRHRGTQCYYPDLQKNAQRLANHLRILEKGFAAYPNVITSRQQNRIKATYYLRALVSDVAVEDDAAAIEHLRAVSGLSNDLLTDEAVFVPLIVNQAAIFAEGPLPEGLIQGVGYGKRILACLRNGGYRSRRFERKVMAQINATLGFVAFAELGARKARPYFIRALLLNPEWRRNRGMLSVLAQSFIGRRLKNRISQLLFRPRSTNA